MLKPGSSGHHVEILQRRLNFIGYKLRVDGVFGSQTEAAVRDFQHRHGYHVTGNVGLAVWSAIWRSYFKKKHPVRGGHPQVEKFNIDGVDLSNNNGGLEIGKIADAKGFVILKATEGKSFVDPYYSERARAFRAAGTVVGAYHFAHPGNKVDAAKQMSFFLGEARPQPNDDLVPAIDWEAQGCGDPRQTPILEYMAQFLRDHTGSWPMVYSYPSMLYAMNISKKSVLRYCPLWFADYGNDPHKEHEHAIPSPWSKVAIRQWTSSGHCPGVPGSSDLDRMWYDVSELIV